MKRFYLTRIKNSVTIIFRKFYQLPANNDSIPIATREYNNVAFYQRAIYACSHLSSFVRSSVNMAVSSLGFVAFLCIIFARSGLSLYFHMGETEKKCFIEEIPDETMVTG